MPRQVCCHFVRGTAMECYRPNEGWPRFARGYISSVVSERESNRWITLSMHLICPQPTNAVGKYKEYYL